MVEKLASELVFLILLLWLLKFIQENMDGKLYCDILQQQLKPFMEQLPKKSNFFFNKT